MARPPTVRERNETRKFGAPRSETPERGAGAGVAWPLGRTGGGVPVFRTIAATTLADESPENIHLASEVLGHADVRSRDYYIRASGLIAARRSHASEDRLLREQHGKVARVSAKRGTRAREICNQLQDSSRR